MESGCIQEIEQGLYLGSLRSLGCIESVGITHVVSAVSFDINRQGRPPHVAWLLVPLRDEEDANLLMHLPAACTFIHAALTRQPYVAPDSSAVHDDDDDEDEGVRGSDGPNSSGGVQYTPSAEPNPALPPKVLVHCQAGVSRSVSVLVAYLMKAKGIDDTEALEQIQRVWPQAWPNDGFRAQLGLFADMRCSLDLEHPVYRLWCLHQVGRRWEEDGWVDPGAFAAVPDATALASSKEVAYRCRKCRAVVACSRNVLPLHEVAAGHKVFRQRRKAGVAMQAAPAPSHAGDGDGGSPAGSSLFLEPMSWMADAVVGAVQGKLYCPGCGARLGSFNWSGITNEAGQWVTPAFQVHASRLDVVRPPRPLPAAAPAVRSTPTTPPNTTTAPAPAAAPLTPPRTAWFTALVLDCDGVLVDSERASCEALRRAMLQVTGLDVPHQFPSDFEELFGMDVRGSVAHYKHKFERHDWEDVDGLAAKVQAAKEVLYRQLTEELGLAAFQGAAPLISEARKLGMSVGIGSSGAPEKIAHNLDMSGLAGLVAPEHIVSAAYVANGKPAPDVYVEALRRLGCTDAGRAVIVEDAVNGLKAAKGAGAYAVGVTTSLSRTALEPWADLVLDDLAALVPLLATLTPPGAG